MRIHRDISEAISKMAPGPYQNQIPGAIPRDGIGEAAGPPWQATPKQTQGPCEGKSPQIQLPEQPQFFSCAAKSSAGPGGPRDCRIERCENESSEDHEDRGDSQ